ncbi:MAG: type III pantothenate kinase [Candidatus Omnitrophota bacterium]
MFLAVDVGNTSITYGLKKRKSFKVWRSPTRNVLKQALVHAEISKQSKKLGFALNKVELVVICSVVPSIDRDFKKNLKKIFSKARILFLGKDVHIPIINKYRYPPQVGKDRLVNALAAKYSHKLPAIIVDFGTAITIDAVSRSGEYLGGAIAPGVSISLNALYEKTDLLPLVISRKPRNVLGKSTSDSVLSGIFYGFGFLVDGLIKGLKKELKGEPIVIATGGNLKLMKQFCREIKVYMPLLTLYGIEIAYNLSKSRENQRNEGLKSKKMSNTAKNST